MFLFINPAGLMEGLRYQQRQHRTYPEGNAIAHSVNSAKNQVLIGNLKSCLEDIIMRGPG